MSTTWQFFPSEALANLRVLQKSGKNKNKKKETKKILSSDVNKF